MYLYETHCHTFPVSKCAKSTVRETLEFYRSMGYEGVFITNHFLDGNINTDRSLPYEERLRFYFSDYENAVRIGREIGISVFLGLELTYAGTDFLIYGLNQDWFFSHPEIEGMKKSQELELLKNAGALIIQAHPFREASYIDHIRLFPRHVHGVEIVNANRSEFENKQAENYANSYGLLSVAGSDLHCVTQKRLAGIMTDTPLIDERDFCQRILSGDFSIFTKENESLK